MTEAQFEEWIKDAELDESEKAYLRKYVGLPYEQNPPFIDHPVWWRQTVMAFIPQILERLPKLENVRNDYSNPRGGTMTEEKFAEMTKDVDLSDKETAILRMQFGLSYNEGLIDQHPALRKRLLRG